MIWDVGNILTVYIFKGQDSPEPYLEAFTDATSLT